jgi:hypothetical protein
MNCGCWRIVEASSAIEAPKFLCSAIAASYCATSALRSSLTSGRRNAFVAYVSTNCSAQALLPALAHGKIWESLLMTCSAASSAALATPSAKPADSALSWTSVE